jgi:transposase
MTEHTQHANEDLIAKVQLLETQNQQLAEEVRWLKEQFLLARHKQFGASSERTDPSQCELLFNEAEAILDGSPKDPFDEKTVTYTRKRKEVGHRQEMIADLPAETREYRLPDEEKVCLCCGGPLHEMSTQTRDELTIIPAQVKVIKHVRYVYSCRHCEKHETQTPVVTAPGPLPIIEKSLASSSAIAHIMGMKFVESMPLYRIEKHFERMGVELPRAIISNWVIKGGELLEVIYNRLKERLILLPILHADETSMQVLKEDGRSAQSKSYMWLYRSGREAPPIVLYEYRATRHGEHPRRFLLDFSGYLHVDGYVGYHGMPGVTLVGCWAHARRKFTDALKVLPKSEQSNPDHLTNIGLKYINKLFEIERTVQEVSPDERRSVRLEQSKPIMDDFKVWLDKQVSQVLPKSALGKALAYCQGQWPKLTVFLTDGRLELDNNRSERSIKPFVIGRKNWLFANTPRGAKTSSIIYSIVETAKENGLNPSVYLEYVLDRLRSIDPRDRNALDTLLPWSKAVQTALKPTPDSAS